MSLTSEQIIACKSDSELFELLSSSMSAIMDGVDTDNLDEYVKRLKSLPKVYWAFGSIYDLDVSIALDDLGWHFRNRYSKALANETLNALIMLGAHEEAIIFEESLEKIKSLWAELGRVLDVKDGSDFPKWYESSGLEKEFDELNQRMWRITTHCEQSLLDYLPKYARENPNEAVA